MVKIVKIIGLRICLIKYCYLNSSIFQFRRFGILSIYCQLKWHDGLEIKSHLQLIFFVRSIFILQHSNSLLTCSLLNVDDFLIFFVYQLISIFTMMKGTAMEMDVTNMKMT